MSASAALFTIFKWLGALYLIYLGIKLWKLSPDNKSVQYHAKNRSGKSFLKSSFIVTALNPKSIAFFVAFLPQFIDPLKPALAQLTLLGGTFLFLATLNAAIYALFAGQLGEHMKKKNVRKWFNRCGGSALIGAGIITAGMQRTT
jgi:threonine/homoserine/homoserine lactone efflux protein